MAFTGPNTFFPIAGYSRKQTCVSHSTPEAEIVAADFALRTAGVPCLAIWSVMLPHLDKVLFHEDNQAMIRVCETGRYPTMRYLQRTRRISVAWLHEVFTGEKVDLQYELSANMRADLYTKAFTDPSKWKAACWLTGVVDPKELADIAALGDNPPRK